MPKKRLVEAQRLQLLEDTKQRLRLEELEIEIEVLENLGRQLRLEHLELSGELECSDTDTARQYTLRTSDDEEDLVEEQDSSSTIKSEI